MEYSTTPSLLFLKVIKKAYCACFFFFGGAGEIRVLCALIQAKRGTGNGKSWTLKIL